MARSFDDAATEYLEIDQAVVSSAAPCTLSAWFNTDDASVTQVLIQIADKDVDKHRFVLQIRKTSSGQNIISWVQDGGTGVPTVTTTTYSTNTWQHACATFASTTSRAVYLDGGGKGTSTTSIDPLNLDRTSIARAGDSTPAAYMSGSIAEVAIWDVDLNDDEVAALAKGFHPYQIRPGNLVFYVPLIRGNDKDLVGGLSLTAFNTPGISVHPRVFYPGRPHIFGVPGAALPATRRVSLGGTFIDSSRVVLVG